MKHYSLLLLRISIGLLFVIWGLDKLVNVQHAVNVSNAFFLGIFSAPVLLNIYGVIEILIGVLVVLGWFRRFTYPVVILISLVTTLGVWKSIIDPWGWIFEGTNALFYPSLITLFASVVIYAFRHEDIKALDNGARRRTDNLSGN